MITKLTAAAAIKLFIFDPKSVENGEMFSRAQLNTFGYKHLPTFLKLFGTQRFF